MTERPIPAVRARRIRRLPRFLRRRAARFANRSLHRIECGLHRGTALPARWAPVFIVGAPRSGSTLLYQLLTERYDVGYISNLHCSAYGAPSLVERVVGPFGRRSSSDYRSEAGETRGRFAPSECGEFWYRFFPRRPHYVAPGETPAATIADLRAAVAALTTAFRRPVVFKNLYCTLRIEPIRQALPEALFVVIHRDLVDNAHSLLHCRATRGAGYEAWFSAEPPGIDELRSLSPAEQVVGQVQGMYEAVDRSREALDSRIIDVQYEELCRDIHGSVERIGSFLRANGVELRPRGDIPASMPPASRKVLIEPELHEQLRQMAEGHAR